MSSRTMPAPPGSASSLRAGNIFAISRNLNKIKAIVNPAKLTGKKTCQGKNRAISSIVTISADLSFLESVPLDRPTRWQSSVNTAKLIDAERQGSSSAIRLTIEGNRQGNQRSKRAGTIEEGSRFPKPLARNRIIFRPARCIEELTQNAAFVQSRIR